VNLYILHRKILLLPAFSDEKLSYIVVKDFCLRPKLVDGGVRLSASHSGFCGYAVAYLLISSQ
jgi:hypothetical protein